MAAIAERTQVREVINERGQRVLVADKAQVVTVEIEPGVYGTQVKHTRAVVAPQAQPVRIAMVTDDSSSMEREDRGCCATAWHCDEGEWYNPCGKGLAWIPFYIILWIILIALGIALLAIYFVVYLITCCCDDEDENS